jgi:RND family efflux transporter MFP subunit
VGSEVTAKVRNVFVTDGDHVVAGQRIADLEDALAKAELAVARARAQAAAGATEALLADLAEAEKALKRLSLLSDRGHAAEVDVDRIRARVAILRAQGEEAKAKQIAAIAEVQRAEAILAQYAIVAPFAGVITGCTAQPGEIISSTSSGSGYIRTGVCTIVDLASIEIEVDVNETQIARVSPATIATATPDAFPALNLKARIRTIVPSASREKSTVKVRLTLEDRDPRILPDMAVKVAFSATQAEAPFHSQPAGRITHE